MGFFTALGFLTIIPIPTKKNISARDLGRSTLFYPLAGAVIGGLLCLSARGAGILWSPGTTAGLVLVLWIGLTRGLHLDGLADTADSLGGTTPEQRRRIMKDSRVGVFGVIVLVGILLLKYVFLLQTNSGWQILLLAPMAGRWVMLLALFSFPAAGKEGLGWTVKQHCRRPQVVIGTVLMLAAAFVILSFWGLVLVGTAALLSGLIAWGLYTRLSGLNGDCYGALCELSELLCLILFSLPFMG
jgi:adenosylcobinamide-GDP ribazoletransferase